MTHKIDPDLWLSKFSTYPLHAKRATISFKSSLKKIISSCKNCSLPAYAALKTRLKQPDALLKTNSQSKIRRLSKSFFRRPSFHDHAVQTSILKNEREHLVSSLTTLREHGVQNLEESLVIQLIAYLDGLSHLHEHQHVISLCSQCLVLFYYEPKRMGDLIQKTPSQDLERAITSQFIKLLGSLNKRLDRNYTKHSKTTPINPDITKELSLGLSLTHLLITPKGYFNVDLIPLILENYFTSANTIMNYKLSFKNNLQFLYQSQALQTKINRLKLPKTVSPQTEFLIRSSLKLQQNTPLTDAHYKKCILSAFLTHLRQSDTGSCFATFIAIQQKAIDPEQVLSDLDQLLKEGYLSRELDHHLVKFPYLMKWDDKVTKHHFQYDEDPFLHKTLQFFGIADTQILLKDFSGQVTTIEKILKAILQDENEVEKGKLFYTAMQCNPLLRVWENSLAGMSEGNKTGILKNALSRSVQFIFNNALQKRKTQIYLEEEIERFIEQNTQYLYDPNYTIEYVDTKGAFILYFQNERLDNVDKFREFLRAIVKNLSLKHPLLLSENAKERIEDHLGQRKTMVKLLKKYHRENYSTTATRGAYQLLRYTPWVTMMGNDPEKVLKVYHQENLQYETFKLYPKDAYDLAMQLLNLLQKLPQKLKTSYLSNYTILTPLIIQGVHSCSFIPSHDTLRSFFIKNVYAKESLDKCQIAGMKIATAPLTYLMRARLMDKIFEQMIDRKLQVSFYAKTRHFPQDLTIKEFRRLVLKQPKELSAHLTQRELQSKLDQMIIEVLPQELRSQWEKSLIHFADSNWNKGSHDLHYTFGLNPLTGEFEIISALDTGEFHEFLDQTVFFKNRIWEFGF